MSFCYVICRFNLVGYSGVGGAGRSCRCRITDEVLDQTFLRVVVKNERSEFFEKRAKKFENFL